MDHRKKDGFWVLLAAGVWPFLYPPFDFGFLAWVALVPLLWGTQGVSAKEAFRRGWWGGTLAHLGIFYWIIQTIARYGDVGWRFLGIDGGICIGVLSWGALSLYLGLYWGLFCSILAGLRKGRAVSDWVAAPILWVVLEYVKSNFLTGFPWENIGYSQHQNLFLIQIAEVTGVYGIIFLVVWVNYTLFQILRDWRRLKIFAKQVELLVVVGLLIAVHLLGYFRLSQVERWMERGKKRTIVLVQGNVPQDQKWSPEFRETTLQKYFDLSRAASSERPDLLVWPETALPFFFETNKEWREKTVEEIRHLGWPFLLGTPSREIENDQVHYYNSALLLSPEGEILGRYDKVHLVPFGEYVPLYSILSPLAPLVPGTGNFSAGEEVLPLSNDSLHCGILICYEVIFPEEGRRRVREGANLLVNMTNDAWFGRTSAPFQHLSMARFRAIENRRYLVRAANTGISAIITPTGRILEQTPLFEEAIVSGEVVLLEEVTFYSRWGDLFAVVQVVLMVGFALITFKRKRWSQGG